MTNSIRTLTMRIRTMKMTKTTKPTSRSASVTMTKHSWRVVLQQAQEMLLLA